MCILLLLFSSCSPWEGLQPQVQGDSFMHLTKIYSMPSKGQARALGKTHNFCP